MKISMIFLAVLLTTSACSGISDFKQNAERNFKGIMDDGIKKHEFISQYLRSPTLSLQETNEVQSGIVEYSFVELGKWFTAPEERCKFIIVAEKNSGTVIGWRYNSKPEYCYINP